MWGLCGQQSQGHPGTVEPPFSTGSAPVRLHSFLPRRPSWAGLYASCTHVAAPVLSSAAAAAGTSVLRVRPLRPLAPVWGQLLSHRPAPHPSRPNGVLDSQAWPGPTEKVVCPRGPRWRPLVPGSHSLSRRSTLASGRQDALGPPPSLLKLRS